MSSKRSGLPDETPQNGSQKNEHAHGMNSSVANPATLPVTRPPQTPSLSLASQSEQAHTPSVDNMHQAALLNRLIQMQQRQTGVPPTLASVQAATQALQSLMYRPTGSSQTPQTSLQPLRVPSGQVPPTPIGPQRAAGLQQGFPNAVRPPQGGIVAGPIGMSPEMIRFWPEGLNQAPMMTQLSPQQQVQIQQQIQQRQMQMQHQHLHQQHQQISASLPLNLAQKKPRYPPPQGPNPPGGLPRPIALVRRPSQGGSLPSSGGGRNGSPNIHSAHLAPTGGVKNTSVAPMSSHVDRAAPPRPPFHSGPRVTREEVEHHMEVGSRMQNAINADHMSVLNPSADPFVNLDDMISRLLPFHVLQSPFHVDNPELQQIPDFAERDAAILKQMDRIIYRYTRLQEMETMDEVTIGKRITDEILAPRQPMKESS